MEYEYKDQHFSVEIAEALLTKIPTYALRTRTIRGALLGYHAGEGGLEPLEGRSGSIIMGRALNNLQKIAKTSAMGNNIWRIAHKDQWIFGDGKHWVYLYYFDQDKQDAEIKGQSVWRCKIGSTKGLDQNGKIKFDAPEARVKNQTRGTPEPPHIALLFRTNLHETLEKVIHGILTLQGKHLRHAQGVEWFLTNPREVVHIVGHIDYHGLIYPVVKIPL